MAFDGIFLNLILEEIKENLLGKKIEKINQPSKDEIVLKFRDNKKYSLLLSGSANFPRIHLTQKTYENPLTPPRFCTLLRKYLSSASLEKAETVKGERIIILTFLGLSELFEKVEKKLVLEIMGKHSNLILLNNDNTIVDSLKRVDFSLSSKRQILPKLTYELPPIQDKISFYDNFDILNLIESFQDKTITLTNFLMCTFSQISPIIARQISYNVTSETDVYLESLTDTQKEKLKFHINLFKNKLLNKEFSPCIIKDIKTKKPLDFSFINITYFENLALVTPYSNASLLCDDFYTQKSLYNNMHQKSSDILKVITNHIARLNKKILILEKDNKKSQKADIYKIYGELITSNIYKIKKGDNKLICDDYYNNCEVEIPLNIRLSPSENAQSYFKKYTKQKTAKVYIEKELIKAENEILYLDSVFDSLSRCEKDSDLNEIRLELTRGNYIKKSIKGQKPPKSQMLEFNVEGFKIIAGKNNIQNDTLISKMAKPKDTWFHVQKAPSSHVVIFNNGALITDTLIESAAKICAQNSKLREGSKITVDYTNIQFVKKIPGAKPGMVTYKNFKSIIVDP